MINDNIYLPVIIPTLNRYEHLKRCVESLQCNTLADKTEIYISVDYPPNEKYIEGWRLVKQYLSQEISGFKFVNVFFQKENLGSHDNFCFLYDQVSIKYDAWISSEDDNEFSSNYLIYMNQAVEYMRSNPEIYSVCGYVSMSREELCKKIARQGYNCFRIQNLDAWGHAYLRERQQKFSQIISFEYLEDIIRTRKKRKKLRGCSRLLYMACIFGLLGKYNSMLSKDKSQIVAMDMTCSIYLIMNDMYQLQPVVSKVRNWGNDGSGLHCGVDNSIQEQIIDKDVDFELNVLPLQLFQSEIAKSVKGKLNLWDWQYLLADVLSLVYRIFGKKIASICYDKAFELYRFIKGVKNGKDT